MSSSSSLPADYKSKYNSLDYCFNEMYNRKFEETKRRLSIEGFEDFTIISFPLYWKNSSKESIAKQIIDLLENYP